MTSGPPDDGWRDLNRARWDERVPIHVASEFYDVAGFLDGESKLRDFEPGELGDLDGRSLVHLQCHFGIDTLCLARLGAEVTGLDFSAAAVAEARSLAERASIPATFVEADVYDARAALGRRRFDVVYTGLGALNWLPDVHAWAEVVASLVAPGGFLYLLEFHPFADVFADESLSVELPYFDPEGQVWDVGGTYTDGRIETVHNRSHEWNHPIGEVVSAVIDAGLQLEFLHEHDYTLFARWPFLEHHDDGTYRMPAGHPSLPLMYSLRARGRE